MVYFLQVVVLLLAFLSSFFKCVKEDGEGKRVYFRNGLPKPTRAGGWIASLLLVSFILSTLTTYFRNHAESAERRSLSGKIEVLDSMLSDVSAQNAELRANVSSVDRGIQGVSAKLDTSIAVAGTAGSQHAGPLRLSLTEGKGKMEIELDRFSRLLQRVGTSIRDSVVAGNDRAGARGFGLGSVAEYEREKSLRPLEDTIISGWDGCEFKIRSLLAEMGYEVAALENSGELKGIGVKYKVLFGQRDSVVAIIRGAIKGP